MTDYPELDEIFGIHVLPYAHNDLVKLDMEGAKELVRALMIRERIKELEFMDNEKKYAGVQYRIKVLKAQLFASKESKR